MPDLKLAFRRKRQRQLGKMTPDEVLSTVSRWVREMTFKTELGLGQLTDITTSNFRDCLEMKLSEVVGIT